MKKLYGLFLLAAFETTAARADDMGIAGLSGRTPGLDCGNCHVSTGGAPTLMLEGPSELVAETAGTFSLTLVGGPAAISAMGVGGLDVAPSGGTMELDPTEMNMQLMAGNITHTAPRPMIADMVVWSFVWRAPLVTTGEETLFAAALSADGDTTDDGDHHALTTLMVQVTGGRLPPEPTPEPVVEPIPEPMPEPVPEPGMDVRPEPAPEPGLDGGVNPPANSDGCCSVLGQRSAHANVGVTAWLGLCLAVAWRLRRRTR